MITAHLQFCKVVFHRDLVCVDSELPDADYLLGRDWWNYHHRLHGLPILLLQVRKLWVSVEPPAASLRAKYVDKLIVVCFHKHILVMTPVKTSKQV